MVKEDIYHLCIGKNGYEHYLFIHQGTAHYNTAKK